MRSSFFLKNQYPDLLNVDWLIELPDDLDMCIAQRSFDAAVKLVEKGDVNFFLLF